MPLTTLSSVGPEFTPKAVIRLILAIALTSLFCALINPLFTFIFKMQGPQEILSLSWYGLKSFYIWEFFSFLFVQEGGAEGINLSYLLALAFNLYLIWIMGTTLCEYFGAKSFIRFFFACGIFAGLLGLLAISITGYYGQYLAGPAPAVLATLIIWTMLNPETELLLFFLVPLKAKWLTTGILGFIFLITLSHLDIVQFVFYLGGAVAGYFYGLLVWSLRSPFVITHPFDFAVNEFGHRIRIKSRKGAAKESNKGKIVNIQTGENMLDDDRFIDEMLAKISKKGENSLSWSEKKRMQMISAKKMKEKKD